ncbi:hypothetical protein CGZ93_11405 [Enemella dayhoffiae]|uniref:citrate synthase (unknown stereospecificity) n=1 Tax=Enemella dayhoffiae TaxID=2016507 RepID=A0A255GZ06_9ACTN|nr:citrate/2-methylcitrate synthase [Enemella dayhoffiae]OYO20830.1 hypothetical protein CGZ93_11405 [Enemella dayhoffiae]
MPEDPRMLSTAQVARRLGIRTETVYAYVSRGVLTRRRLPGQRGSYFSLDEVDALTRPQGPQRTRRSPGLADDIRTAITLIEGDRLYFRGVEATELARRHRFEQVCELLWQQPADFTPDGRALRRVRSAASRLPADAAMTTRLRVLVELTGLQDPARGDLAPAAVAAAGARAITLAVHALPRVQVGGTVADCLAEQLAGPRPSARVRDLVRRALVLLADHDMAVSTTAARVAASARANPYAVLATALGPFDSPLHGSAPAAAYRWFAGAVADPQRVLTDALAAERPPAGFGHRIYRDRDPRAEHLLARWQGPRRVGEPLAMIRGQLLERRGWFPTSDAALAAYALGWGLPPETGELIFGVARMAGWIAHAIEEYAAEPLRFRLGGVYVGPRPSS